MPRDPSNSAQRGLLPDWWRAFVLAVIKHHSASQCFGWKKKCLLIQSEEEHSSSVKWRREREELENHEQDPESAWSLLLLSLFLCHITPSCCRDVFRKWSLNSRHTRPGVVWDYVSQNMWFHLAATLCLVIHWSFFLYSHQSQDEHDELHVPYEGPGEGAGLHPDRGHPGRVHAEVWQGARRGIPLWWAADKEEAKKTKNILVFFIRFTRTKWLRFTLSRTSWQWFEKCMSLFCTQGAWSLLCVQLN